MSRLFFIVSAVLTMCLLATQVTAEDRSMRCGRHLIHAGGIKESATMYEVLKKCGQPEAKMGSSWIYVQGNVHRTLTFGQQGRLQRIDSERN